MEIKRRRSFNVKSFLAKVGEGRSIGNYRKDQIVFSQGDSADAIFYLQSGKVKITIDADNGKKAVVAVHGAAEFFGEKCLAKKARRMSSATSLTDSVIMRLGKAAIVRVIHQEPEFAEMFIGRLLDRTIRVEADLVAQLCKTSEQRLARLLLLLASMGRKEKRKPMMTKISQETLAEMTGTTRSRVSFFMNKFRKLGLISYSGDNNGGIEVHSSLLNAVLHKQPQIKT